MTLQQMHYLVAVNKHRHFNRAAEECGVTQPTLSAMILKLEEELDVKIFDRSSYPIVPTLIGKRLIDQARVVLNHVESMKEIVHSQKLTTQGRLRIGIIPTVAPYLVPSFIDEYSQMFPHVELNLADMRTAQLLEKLKRAEIDFGIAATPLNDSAVYEIPLYYERFVAYVSPKEPFWTHQHISSKELNGEHLWVMSEGHCFRNQVQNFCKLATPKQRIYEAGSIHTLIQIVDTSGGYTIIPELHIDFLTEAQKTNLRPLEEPIATREISLLIRKDCVRERLVNTVAEVVKKIIPPVMLDERFKKFSIRI